MTMGSGVKKAARDQVLYYDARVIEMVEHLSVRKVWCIVRNLIDLSYFQSQKFRKDSFLHIFCSSVGAVDNHFHPSALNIFAYLDDFDINMSLGKLCSTDEKDFLQYSFELIFTFFASHLRCTEEEPRFIFEIRHHLGPV